jgi:pimeloyl-ACP methyl ester carboxylesterase
MVLVHGDFGNGLIAWGHQMKALPGYHRLLVVDRRGHGASPREPRPYTIGGDAADVLDAADRAGVDRFHLVGHSYGGLVAVEVARRAPERVRSLHLIEPPYLGLLPEDPEVVRLVEETGAVFDRARSWGPERTAARFFEIVLGPSGLAELIAHPAWSDLVAEASRVADAERPSSYPPDALGDLRVSWPVRVYTGGQSHPALRRVARRLAESLPGAVLVEVPGATHAVQRWAEPFHRALLQVTRPDLAESR